VVPDSLRRRIDISRWPLTQHATQKLLKYLEEINSTGSCGFAVITDQLHAESSPTRALPWPGVHKTSAAYPTRATAPAAVVGSECGTVGIPPRITALISSSSHEPSACAATLAFRALSIEGNTGSSSVAIAWIPSAGNATAPAKDGAPGRSIGIVRLSVFGLFVISHDGPLDGAPRPSPSCLFATRIW
jgi:hypothetical protein